MYDVFFQSTHITTKCDTRSILKLDLMTIPWKNCSRHLGTSPFWECPQHEVITPEKRYYLWGLKKCVKWLKIKKMNKGRKGGAERESLEIKRDLKRAGVKS